jgi:hypothetical protein
MWVEGNPGTYRRGSVSNLNRALLGAELALGHYSAGTAVLGAIPLPQLTHDDALCYDSLRLLQSVPWKQFRCWFWWKVRPRVLTAGQEKGVKERLAIRIEK